MTNWEAFKLQHDRKVLKFWKHGGFTLVELLVVISIIALLLAILMPSLQKVRMQGQSIVCKTRLKDIGSAVMLYVSDNRGDLPNCTQYDPSTHKYLRGYRWMDRIGKYHNRATMDSGKNANGTEGVAAYPLYRCPTQDKYTRMAKQEVSAAQQTTGAIGIYGYNEFFTNILAEYYNVAPGAGGPSIEKYNWRKCSSIKLPGTLPLFADFDGDDSINGGTSYQGWLLYSTAPHPAAIVKYKWNHGQLRGAHYSYNGPAPNHGGKTNYLLADFHVETMPIWPWRDFIGTDFHPKRNVNVNP